MSRVRRERRQAATIVESGRGALGAGHLLRPGHDRHVAVFNRVLGVRQLVQAVLLLRAGSGNAHVLGAAVDATHAVTMVPMMFVGGRWGRIAVRQFLIATALAVAEVALVGTGGRRGTGRRR
ncbi:hypothetical protein [Curtobacterium sp. 9128]|uniref:hypothetical protein n=1 Tax=Curtobacterium sp. 9128 TaxID=1793722 RepID=UPI0011A3BA28|nr:hypothetical protein [Curtobacterium sp. 9128]